MPFFLIFLFLRDKFFVQEKFPFLISFPKQFLCEINFIIIAIMVILIFSAQGGERGVNEHTIFFQIPTKMRLEFPERSPKIRKKKLSKSFLSALKFPWGNGVFLNYIISHICLWQNLESLYLLYLRIGLKTEKLFNKC